MDDAFVRLALMAYCGEPCRVCGAKATPDDLPRLVFAGYSVGNEARSAHGECWAKAVPKDRWAYPVDAEPGGQ